MAVAPKHGDVSTGVRDAHLARPTRLGQLAEPAVVVPASMPAVEAERHMVRDGLARVLVAHDDGGLELLTRERLFVGLAGRLGYGRMLMQRRTVAWLSQGAEVLMLPGDVSLDEAGRAALARPAHLRYEDVAVRGEDGALSVVPLAHLLSEIADMHAERAVRDPLTGLPNRASLFSRLRALLEHPVPGRRACLLFVDVDDFKQVNDGLGHRVGDELLIAIADRLRRAFRTEDLVVRLSGDEFVVALNVEDAAQGQAAADRAHLALAAPLEVAGRLLPLHCSVGVAVATDELEPEELLRAADLAMYEAKRAGKARSASFRPALHEDAVRRIELAQALPGAVERGELSVAFQPVLALDTGRPRGLEALARWSRPGLGPVSPAEFIPIAEETGEIIRIGAFVLETACAQVRAWDEVLPGVALGVNVSPVELDAGGYAERVAGVLERTGLAPERLTLEVTENALLDDHGAGIGELRRLEALGIRLALDDFGVGRSGLPRLVELPVRMIKLDRSIVSAQDTGSRDTISGLLALADAMGLIILAEGVETEEQAERLRELGCPLAQGFLFARPMPADDVTAWLAEAVAPTCAS
jgi:diguanylate cyclase (GGDEF)-like protein